MKRNPQRVLRPSLPWFVLLFSICPLLSAQRIITTFAGADWVFGADGKAAVAAPLGQISAIATSPQGDLYIADSDNNLVLRVDPAGIVH